ncbi:2440_t:CDS:10 [Funneliformis geosporum]|nr:2440_t:CDS:10 [Funneliformis geosporum]
MEVVLKSHRSPYEKEIALYNCSKNMEVGELQPIKKKRIEFLLLSKLHGKIAKQSLKQYEKLAVEDYIDIMPKLTEADIRMEIDEELKNKAKRTGQNLEDALEQAKNYARKRNTPIAYAIIDKKEVDFLLDERTALHYTNINEYNPTEIIVVEHRRQLIQIFSFANNQLRAAGLTEGDERFSEFCSVLFLKLLSEDEEKADKDKRRSPETIIPFHLRGKHEKEKFCCFQSKYGEDIFNPLLVKKPAILKRIIDKMTSLHLSSIKSDIKGDAFEYFLKEALKKDKQDLGTIFYSSPHCGILIKTFHYLYEKIPKNDKGKLKRLKEGVLYGNELTRIARVAKMNMILTGDGHNNIKKLDSLENPAHGKYDIVITNMPFSLKGPFDECQDLYLLGKANGNNSNEEEKLKNGFQKLDVEVIRNNNYVSIPNIYKKFTFETQQQLISLGELVEELTIRNSVNAPVWSVTNDRGFVLSEENFSERVASKDVSNYKLVPPQNFAYSPPRINVGSINYNDSEKIGCVSPIYVAFKVKNKEKVVPQYLFCLFQSEKFKEQEETTIKRLGEIASFEYGNYDGKGEDKGKYKLVRITDLDEYGNISEKDLKYTDLSKEFKTDKFLSKGDIVVSRQALPARAGVFEEEKAVLSSNLWDRQVRELTKGTAQPVFSANSLREIQIPIPSLEKQREIIEEREKDLMIIDYQKQKIRCGYFWAENPFCKKCLEMEILKLGQIKHDLKRTEEAFNSETDPAKKQELKKIIENIKETVVNHLKEEKEKASKKELK